MLYLAVHDVFLVSHGRTLCPPSVFPFTPKSSDLRTYYLPGGQTDAEVFVERNIDISSIYEAILYLFQFQNKNGRFPAVYLSLRMRGIKRSRGEEFARL